MMKRIIGVLSSALLACSWLPQTWAQHVPRGVESAQGNTHKLGIMVKDLDLPLRKALRLTDSQCGVFVLTVSEKIIVEVVNYPSPYPARIEASDIIQKVNNQEVKDVKTMAKILRESPENNVQLTILHRVGWDQWEERLLRVKRKPVPHNHYYSGNQSSNTPVENTLDKDDLEGFKHHRSQINLALSNMKHIKSLQEWQLCWQSLWDSMQAIQSYTKSRINNPHNSSFRFKSTDTRVVVSFKKNHNKILRLMAEKTASGESNIILREFQLGNKEHKSHDMTLKKDVLPQLPDWLLQLI